MDSIWIMSYGPVLVDKQFTNDMRRLHPNITLNDIVLPKNIYESLQQIYDTCHIHYFLYTKYLNQTLGNLMTKYIQKITYNKHILPLSHTYKVNAVYKPFTKYIQAKMLVKLIDNHLKYIKTIRIECLYSIDDDRTIIKIKYI